MKLKKYILCAFITTGLAFNLTGCDDLFRDAPVDKMSEKDVWRNSMLLDEYVLPWYRNMNNGFSTYVPTTIALVKSASRYYMPWFGDQVVPSKTDYYNAGYGDLLKSNTQEITNWAQVNWSKYYTQIQSINRLFQNQDEITEGSQKQRILGEAHFFRAYYYFILWRQFGGVMLIQEPLDPLQDARKYPRASYPEMVAAIVKDAKEAARILPVEHESTDKGRITKGAALMLIAKTYQWASSEIFQNKEKSYLGFTDDRSHEMLDSAKTAYENLLKKIALWKEDKTEVSAEAHKISQAKLSQYLTNFDNYMFDDLKTPQALSVVWSLVKDAEVTSADKLKFMEHIEKIFTLNLLTNKPAEQDVEVTPEAKALIEERKQARLNKDWAKSDELRDKLKAMGYGIKDIAGNEVEITKL